MADDGRMLDALALIGNGVQVAIGLLVNCLKNNGALRDGQFEAALNRTITHPDAERERLDYLWLASLLRALEQNRGPSEPAVKPIPLRPRTSDEPPPGSG